jgi:hypothetical protein
VTLGVELDLYYARLDVATECIYLSDSGESMPEARIESCVALSAARVAPAAKASGR